MVEENQNQIDMTVGTRNLANKESVAEFLSELIRPSTIGFDHLNLDMTFTNLPTMFDVIEVENSSFIINVCSLFSWKRSAYLEWGKLATALNSRKSLGGWSGKLLTTIQTNQEQKFKDETKKSKGFNFFGFKNKNE